MTRSTRGRTSRRGTMVARAILGGAAAVAATGAVLVASASGAGAVTGDGTNALVSSNPGPNQVVTVPPTQLQLVFRDPLASAEDAGRMGLSLSCGTPATLVGLSTPQVAADLRTVSAALVAIPPAGLCTVSWSLPDLSTGSFTFTSNVATATTVAGETTGGGETTPTTVPVIGERIEDQRASPRVGGALGLVRIVMYLCMAAVFGALAVFVTAWPEGPEYGVTLRYLRLAWAGALASAWLVAALEAMRRADVGLLEALVPFEWFGDVGGAGGAVAILRVLLVGGVGWAAWSPRRVLDPNTQVPVAVGAVAMIATLGLGRLGQDVPVLAHPIGVVHAIAVAFWVGGLLLMTRVVLVGPGETDLVTAVRTFARQSTAAMAVAVVTGVVQFALLDGTAILTSGHGRVLVLKLLVAAPMVFITLVLRTFVHERLARADDLPARMAWRLKRATGVEATFAVVVMLVTSWAVASTPPKASPRITAPPAAYAFREELRNDRFHVIVSLTPATTGVNAMRIELLEPRRINNFTVNLVPQAIGYAGVAISVPLERPGAAIVPGDGTFTLVAPGVWNLEITGTTTTGDLTPLATTFAVTESAPTG
ncbi:MAG: CopD family protein [Acidimicrobiia bacterium]